MVYVLLGTGFEEVEAITPIDLLRRAGIGVITVGLNGQTVYGSHNIGIQADITIDQMDISQMDMIVLPGGLGGVASIKNCQKAMDAIVHAQQQGKWIAAICAAPTLVAKYGYLEGKNAVCYPSMENELYGANCVDAAVVRDGKIITARAAGASEEFSFELIRALVSKDAAEKVRHAIYAR
jgi:4-methyl-5(b-hydroxyethyl)-thiazole monophosphate biosynthesis